MQIGDRAGSPWGAVRWIGRAKVAGCDSEVGIAWFGGVTGDVTDRHGLAVLAWTEGGEPVARVAINVEGAHLDAWSFVVNHDLAPLDRAELLRSGLFVSTGERVAYGYVDGAPVYRVADEVIVALVERARAGSRYLADVLAGAVRLD